jgi:hypothetical protein
MDTHSSLLPKSVNYGQKKLFNIGPCTVCSAECLSTKWRVDKMTCRRNDVAPFPVKRKRLFSIPPMIGKRSDLGAATFGAVTKIRATFGKLTTKLKCTMFKKYYDILENFIELDNMYCHNTQQNVS